MPEFRLIYRPNRRPSFNSRWYPLVCDVQAERAVVSAVNISDYDGPTGRYRVDVGLYRWQPPHFGRRGHWAATDPAHSATGVHVPGLTGPDERGTGDHVELLCPVRVPVWECRWCERAHEDLPAASRCAAACWDRFVAGARESQRRFWEANRDKWWAKPPTA